MLTLLLDSANEHLSIGFVQDDELVFAYHEKAWQKQSELMVAIIDKALKEKGWTRANIDQVMVGIGPGSYTGVRIALTVAKVIAIAINIPLIPVSSLQILSHPVHPSIVLINARSNRSYFGVYHGEKTLVEDRILTNEEAIAYCEKNSDYILCGDLQYLELKGVVLNPLSRMKELLPLLKASTDPLQVNPIYLKKL
ncbi:MAG: tRNA (adenosine(37)-N6)-threonylcarbamoyltransferase complex dimerization subunit type 1 TsaB [Bacilli bacterium]|jgi:tRNA threonylcarbamoyladenosine biosynthesis protein TsaB